MIIEVHAVQMSSDEENRYSPEKYYYRIKAKRSVVQSVRSYSTFDGALDAGQKFVDLLQEN